MSNKPRLLMVDDNQAVLDSLHRYFRLRKWRCDKADGGAEALRLAQSRHYEICLMDLGLEEEMDGIFTIEQINRLSPETIFLIYTGKLDFEFPESLRGMGMDENNVLLKPLQMSLLEKKITDLLDRNENE